MTFKSVSKTIKSHPNQLVAICKDGQMMLGYMREGKFVFRKEGELGSSVQLSYLESLWEPHLTPA